jgi:hypothetical protein
LVHGIFVDRASLARSAIYFVSNVPASTVAKADADWHSDDMEGH